MEDSKQFAEKINKESYSNNEKDTQSKDGNYKAEDIESSQSTEGSNQDIEQTLPDANQPELNNEVIFKYGSIIVTRVEIETKELTDIFEICHKALNDNNIDEEGKNPEQINESKCDISKASKTGENNHIKKREKKDSSIKEAENNCKLPNEAVITVNAYRRASEWTKM